MMNPTIVEVIEALAIRIYYADSREAQRHGNPASVHWNKATSECRHRYRTRAKREALENGGRCMTKQDLLLAGWHGIEDVNGEKWFKPDFMGGMRFSFAEATDILKRRGTNKDGEMK